MKTCALVLMAVVLAGCPETPGLDGGTGGGGAATGGGSGGGAATGGGGGAATGGGGGAATGGGSGAVDSYCAALQAANCAKDVRCGVAAPGADCQKLVIPARISLINARLDCLSPALRANLSSGLTLFDGAKAQQCLAAIATTATCIPGVTSVAADPSCNEVFTGTVALGSPCFGVNECGPGLYCDSTELLCPGTCTQRVGVGGLTPSVLGCEFGLVYASSGDGGIVCLAPATAGQNCKTPGFLTLPCIGANSCQAASDGGLTCQVLKTPGQPCTLFSYAQCTPDSACAVGTDGGAQCVALRRMGESCGGNLSCQAGLACLGGVCGALVAAGATCAGDLDCVSGHVCKAATCQPFVGLDAGCDTRPFQGDCAVGSFCNAAARCEALHTLGEACAGNECSIEQGLTCNLVTDGGTSRCRPLLCRRP